MRRIGKALAVAMASAAFAFSLPANAAVYPCAGGGIDLTVDQCVWSPGPPGNDFLTSVEAAIAAATGVDVSSLDLALYGKSDDGSGRFSFSAGNPDGAMSTDWSVLDGTLIKYVTIKAANEFKVYELAGAGASVGTAFSTVGLLTPNKKNQPAISHLSFWTASSAVPEPSTWALLLLGFGAIGWGIRRSKAAHEPRMRVLYD
jgi:hypothetical protein